MSVLVGTSSTFELKSSQKPSLSRHRSSPFFALLAPALRSVYQQIYCFWSSRRRHPCGESHRSYRRRCTYKEHPWHSSCNCHCIRRIYPGFKWHREPWARHECNNVIEGNILAVNIRVRAANDKGFVADMANKVFKSDVCLVRNLNAKMNTFANNT